MLNILAGLKFMSLANGCGHTKGLGGHVPFESCVCDVTACMAHCEVMSLYADIRNIRYQCNVLYHIPSSTTLHPHRSSDSTSSPSLLRPLSSPGDRHLLHSIHPLLTLEL